MSRALVKVMDPYQSECQTLDAYKALVALTALAWNLSTFPAEQQEKELKETLSKVSRSDRITVHEMLLFLLRRKNRLFPSDRRLVVDYVVSTLGTRFHLTVMFADTA